MPTPKAEKDCPDLQQYQRLAASKLSDGDKEALLQHLESCDHCANRLSSLPDQDVLAKLLRQAGTVPERGSRETIAVLVARLSKLRPHSAPSSSQLFSCPACGKGMKIPDDSAGKQVKCPYCKRIVGVPAAATPAPSTTVDFCPAANTNRPGQLQETVDLHPAREADQKFRDFLSAAEAPDEIGRLGPYRVLKVLGSGGMGVVFRAEDPQLLRPVALKAMLPALAVSENARRRFVREAQAAAAIRHDHIVAVYQVGEDRGVPYLAMEFLEGEPLDERLRRDRKLPVAEVIRVGSEIARGLAAAHKRGLIHRDIKPANIWLEAETGRVKILDFGLARAATEGGQLTQLGAVVGTPGYMAPEQGQGKTVDPRCDLFSLGCVLYRMATGKQAFQGSDLVSSIMAVNTHHPSAPHKLNAKLPRSLSQLIMKLLTKEPEGRPSSAQAVVEALERIAREQDAPPPAAKPRASRKWPFLVGAAACLLLGSLLVLWASGVIRVKTKDGTIVLANLPADATVLVDGGMVKVEWDKGKSATIRIAPGKQHQLQIEKEGFKVFAKAVDIDAGREQTIEVRLEPASEPDKGSQPAPTEKKLPSPSAELMALRRDKIPDEALTAAGGGDPKRAPAQLVGVLGDSQPLHSSAAPWADKSYVHGLAFSSDGHWLASGCNDGSIILREAATGRARCLLRGHTVSVRHLAFSKDCKTLVSGGLEGTVKLWPVQQDGEPRTLQPQLGELWSLAVSADGRFLAVGGTTGGVKLWKWGAWDAPLALPAEKSKPWSSFTGWQSRSCLALSPDGRFLAVQTQESVEKSKESAPIYLYTTADGKLADTLPASWSSFVLTFSADGKYLASWAGHRRTIVWEVASRKRVAEFSAGQFGGVAISPDNSRIAVSISFAIGIEVFNLATQQKERAVGHGLNDSMSVAFSPDGKTLAAGFFDGTVHLWNTRTWEEIYQERGHGYPVGSVQFSPDGRAILSAGGDNTVRRWDLRHPGQNRIVRKIEARLSHARYFPDGKKYVTLVKPIWFDPIQTIVVWDSATDKELFVVKPAVGLDDIVFSPDGKLLAGSSWPTNDAEKATFVYLWDAETGNQVHRFADCGDVQHCLPAFSKDGKLLAVASPKLLKVWEVASGHVVHEWQDDLLCAVAFGPDGQTLVTGHSNGTITLWDLAGKQKKKTLTGHTAQVQSLRFTPDGRRLISSGHDGTIRIWNPEWDRAVEVITLGQANVRLLMDVDPSGQYLIATGRDPVIFVLRLTQP